MSPATVTKLVVSLGIVLTVFIVAVILMVTVADWLFFIVLTMFGLGAYLVYYILKHSRVEYEYTFVLGELRIARIKGNAKRRTITYFDVKNIDDIGHYINAETGKRTIDPSKYPNLLHAAEDDYALDTYYFIIHDKVRKKPAVLLMTPNEKTFSMIRPYLSVELKKKFLKMQKEAGLRLQTEEDNRPTIHRKTWRRKPSPRKPSRMFRPFPSKSRPSKNHRMGLLRRKITVPARQETVSARTRTNPKSRILPSRLQRKVLPLKPDSLLTSLCLFWTKGFFSVARKRQ